MVVVAYLLTVVVLFALVGVVGLLAGPLAALCAAVVVGCLLLEGWVTYRPATGRRASR